ncbi:phosphoglycolate phosphatase [Aquibium sp. A9E412]|uniref:phosphoglycolate phosphatase n=1 Tax=Aquibium sp. A9E412 TaxID=2976767 RepID=UPI0025B1C1DA|nr:phosphoglycolate phosphatase [Aquibium sp. A9E412]MDN2566659.1 phosphoglycolate phosphatase [Aquibium sp. A9E412]
MSGRAGAAGWPRAVLFDLDGTLVDSAPDLHGAVDAVLARHGLAPLDLDAVRGMVGDGVKKLVERAFAARGRPLTGAALDVATDEMMAVYGGRLTDLTRPMPAAAAAARRLAATGAGLAVVTNKPRRFAVDILAAFGLADLFAVVVGGDGAQPRKPAPDMLLAATAALGATPDMALMVGDSAADVKAARAAGIAVVAVRGGYTGVPPEALGADRVIDSLAGLEPAIAALAPTPAAG